MWSNSEVNGVGRGNPAHSSPLAPRPAERDRSARDSRANICSVRTRTRTRSRLRYIYLAGISRVPMVSPRVMRAGGRAEFCGRAGASELFQEF